MDCGQQLMTNWFDGEMMPKNLEDIMYPEKTTSSNHEEGESDYDGEADNDTEEEEAFEEEARCTHCERQYTNPAHQSTKGYYTGDEVKHSNFTLEIWSLRFHCLSSLTSTLTHTLRV